ncbi:MAG: YraN family protein [Geminicoccaceae bacterium]|nr:YraN family protein [Geminicoccaceae bacterium]
MTASRSASDRRHSEKRGRRAELAALWFLRLKGYELVARRFSTPVGEIDLVVRRGELLVFVEVKRRTSKVAALDALGATQRARIARAAALFLQRRPSLCSMACRFDLVAIGGFLPVHVEDAWRL